jgi:glutamate dehydrogenase/leucine dehydrogenase
MAASREASWEVSGLQAHIVVDRFVHGLAAGGLRISESVDLHELRRLARTMTYKWALLGIPIGGCKLGIRGDPSRSDKALLLQEFARAARRFLVDRIVTGPDMGTSPSDLRLFFREMGQDSYDVASKALRARGYRPTARNLYRSIMRAIQNRVTGLAVARAAEVAWREFDGTLANVTVSIQGFGSVGRVVAEEMNRMGARIVCIADHVGSLWDPHGLDVAELGSDGAGLMKRSGLSGSTRRLPREEWLQVQADILVPAAVADAISWENVSRVKARMVVEAANIPVAEDVEVHLHENGVLVLPDFVVNAGLAGAFGILVTEEWRRAGDVLREVIRRITSSSTRVVEEALRHDLPPREVAVRFAKGGLEG